MAREMGIYFPGMGQACIAKQPRFTKGRMAELADARDLKSRIPKGVCGFDPRFGQ
jgi:hypothetical protein